jgi:5-methylcytosine-specific restriction endonuclease McrA
MVDKRHPAWAKLYDRARWKKRAKFQLACEPFCALCLQRGEVVAAEICDHVVPHHGDELKFWFGKLQSLCKNCHDGAKRHVERKGFDNTVGADGMPTDPLHPIYRYGQ